MSRGDYSSLRDSRIYKNARKQWYVELIQSQMYWYDLMVNEPEGLDTRRHIPEMLKSLKQQVENNLDKRFVYFIASRKRIRSSKKKPKYSLFSGELKIYIDVGREREGRCVKMTIRDPETGAVVRPRVTTTETLITFHDEKGNGQSFPIHDFFVASDMSLGFTSEVHYVGFTKNPHKRPIDGSHAGLNEVLYKLSDGDSDIFIYYNLFKITTQASDSERGLNFLVSNAMIDEIPVDKEGSILEKCLILYFNSDIQKRNRASEEGELKNSLVNLVQENKIDLVTMHLEMENPSEYFCFGSTGVLPKHKHVFSCQIINNDLIVKIGSPAHDEVFGAYQ